MNNRANLHVQRIRAEQALSMVLNAREYYDGIHGFIGIKAKLAETIRSLEYAVKTLKEQEDKANHA